MENLKNIKRSRATETAPSEASARAFISKWSNWWILNPRRKQLDDVFEIELNELIEREVALRIHDYVGRSELLTAFAEYCDKEHGLFIPSWMVDGYNKSR